MVMPPCPYPCSCLYLCPCPCSGMLVLRPAQPCSRAVPGVGMGQGYSGTSLVCEVRPQRNLVCVLKSHSVDCGMIKWVDHYICFQKSTLLSQVRRLTVMASPYRFSYIFYWLKLTAGTEKNRSQILKEYPSSKL